MLFRSPKAICFENKYNTGNAKAGLDEYDETFKKYLAKRESNARDCNWSQRISDTYTSFEFKDDYELLKQQGYITNPFCTRRKSTEQPRKRG